MGQLIRPAVKQTSQEKGADLEQAFRRHMLQNLGFARADTNQQVNGHVVARAWEADIIGVKHQPIWRVVYILALAIMLAGILTLLSPRAVPQVSNVMTTAGARVQKVAHLKPAGAGIILIGCAAFFIALTGDRRSRRRVWVECKNCKVRVNRDAMYKTVNAVNDVRKRAGLKRAAAIDDIWYVSALGYDVDAVNVARANKVVLFLAVKTPRGTTFERVS
jgi:hypothetical protein